ncbi:MAG: ABC transporter ATP-binding protein [Alphaproteobacteria bacterium]|nr:ABC transporter ATP-binding protein [Alphaproteobacteria bacterium]
MLAIDSINTFYARAHILQDVSLQVEEGECVALLGRNGAGKTTTLKTVMGLVRPKSGRVLHTRKDITGHHNYRIARGGIGYVPEERRIFPQLTVYENLMVGKKDHSGTASPWTLERIYGLFPKLEELHDRLGGQLSGGEQQMLTVARTLMGNPRLLLLDEPTEGLAPIIVQNMIGTIKELKKEGLSVLLSEQNQYAAHALCDRAYILEKGQVVFDGTMQDLKSKPEIQEQYLSVKVTI